MLLTLPLGPSGNLPLNNVDLSNEGGISSSLALGTAGASTVIRTIDDLGDTTVPRDVRRRRRWVADAMRRLGTPVLVKHRFSELDLRTGVAIDSPNFFSAYGQTRSLDPISHGVGFTSAVTSSDEWITPDGTEIINSQTFPGAGYLPAPRYRGYAQGYLTYIIMPDVALDYLRYTDDGVLFKAQDARAVAPWYPEINDNDLIIAVTLDVDNNIVGTQERFEVKRKTPITMRGHDKRGLRGEGAAGNRYVVNQQFEMVALPDNHPAFAVETDR